MKVVGADSEGDVFTYPEWLKGFTKSYNEDGANLVLGDLPEGMKGSSYGENGTYNIGKRAHLGGSGKSEKNEYLYNVVIKDWYDGPDQCIDKCLSRNFPSAMYRLHGLYGIDWEDTVEQYGKEKGNTFQFGPDTQEQPGNMPTHATCYCYTTPFVSSSDYVEYDTDTNTRYTCDSSNEYNQYYKKVDSLWEHFDVTYTFSCEAGTYYATSTNVRMDNDDDAASASFRCSQCEPGTFSLESFPVHFMDGNSWGYLKGPKCQQCPIGSEPVTMLGHTYKIYREGETTIYDKEGDETIMTRDQIKEASHASMCKKCPSGRVDGRTLGFDVKKGCVSMPLPRIKQFTFKRKPINPWYCKDNQKMYCASNKFCVADCSACAGLGANDTVNSECVTPSVANCGLNEFFFVQSNREQKLL